MNFNIILICFTAIQITLLIIVGIFMYKKVFPYLDKRNEIREKEIKNKKYELFNNISIENINTELDHYFDIVVNRYIVYKFVSKKTTYIGADETEIMIRDLTKSVILEMSELYVYYVSVLVSINNQEDLVRFINNKIRNNVIEAVTTYNKSEQILNL